MGKKKEILTKSINFGKQGEPARAIVEEYIKQNGKQALSGMVRQAVVCWLGTNPAYKKHKIFAKIQQAKQLDKKATSIMKEFKEIKKEIEKLGGNPDLAYSD